MVATLPYRLSKQRAGHAASGPPSAPASLTATPGDTEISLDWPNVFAATSYSVFQGTSPGGETVPAIVTGLTVSNYVVTGLTNGTTYYFKVTASNAAGESPRSPEASATPTVASGDYPSGISVIKTPHDWYPNLTRTPTITSGGNGNWGTAATWEQNRVPQAGDIVGIRSGHTVTYDVNSTASITGVGVNGTLQFRTDIDTKLRVQHVIVYPVTGYWKQGTVTAPIDAAKTSVVEFADVAIDTDADPYQFGNGFLGLGRVEICGAPKTKWGRPTAAPAAGNTSLTLTTSPAGWRAGDRLHIGDSRQMSINTVPDTIWPYTVNDDTPTLSSVVGSTVNFTAGLTYAHPGARDKNNTLRYTPHLVNLTRNVVFTSENPNGTRGHFLVTHDARVNIQNAMFYKIGRTLSAPLNNTAPDSTTGGAITHVGTNQIGRYQGPHLHHVCGPNPAIYDLSVTDAACANSTTLTSVTGGFTSAMIGERIIISGGTNFAPGRWNGTYFITGVTNSNTVTLDRNPTNGGNATGGTANVGSAFVVKGCTVEADDGFHDRKGGISIHGSCFGNVSDNVTYNVSGFGLWTETGDERENIIDGNYVSRCNCYGQRYADRGDGRGMADLGHRGDGFWFRGFDNYVRNNVAVNCRAGFMYFAYNSSDSLLIPNFPGACNDEPENCTATDIKAIPILQFDDNEFYGGWMIDGGQIWNMGFQYGHIFNEFNPPAPEPHADRNIVWHAATKGYYGYEHTRLTFNDWVFLNDFQESVVVQGGRPLGIYWGDYTSMNFKVVRAEVFGFFTGIDFASTQGTDMTVQDSDFRCHQCFVTNVPYSTRGALSVDPQTFRIVNCTASNIDNLSHGDITPIHIRRNLSSINNNNWLVNWKVIVTNWQGVSADNFIVHPTLSAASAITPPTTYYPPPYTDLIIDLGSPETGKTNTYNLATYPLQVFDPPVSSAHREYATCVNGVISPTTATRTGVDGYCESF